MGSAHQTGGHRSTDDVVVGLTGARFGGAAGRRSRAVQQPAEDAGGGGTHHHRGDRPTVDPVGARFRSASKRWRAKKGDPGHPGPTPPNPDDSANTDSVHTDSANIDSASAGSAVQPPHQKQPVPQSATTSSATTSWAAEPSWVDGAEWIDWSDWEAVHETGGLVRPYFWTGGRTASRYELSFETLISATGQPIDPTAPPEHRTILTLCTAPRSVAELAALLSMPLGVVRVLLGDMAEAGSVAVHRTVGSADAAPDLDLMQRVLNGLQRL